MESQIPLCVPVQISVDRGLKWEEAYEKSLKLTGTYDGFYLSYKVRPWALPGWHLSSGVFQLEICHGGTR